MAVANKFKKFNQNIKISANNVDKISKRYKQITKRLNQDFWEVVSENRNSLYVGSYGRGTATYVSDVDILFRLPYPIYQQYDKYDENGQSALLQAIRNSLQKTYSTSHIKGDGQIIGINFDDGINFEIVPCFINKDGSYTYPNTNEGGSWKITNPKAEIEELKNKNKEWNYNLKELCRMIRAWKNKWNVVMSGLLIDTLAYNFLKKWEYKNNSYEYHDWMIRDFFRFLKNQDENQNYWLAVGSNQYILRAGNFKYKSLRCYNISLEAIDYEEREMPYSADGKWKEIFGLKFNQ